MARGEFDIRQASTLPSRPATDGARRSPWLPPLTPEGGQVEVASAPVVQPPAAPIPSPVSAPPAPPIQPVEARPPELEPEPMAAQRGLRAWLRRLWGARGLFGGLLAIGIAALGQNALVTENDYVTSTRNYFIAIVIVILSLLHPTWPSFLKRWVKGVRGHSAQEASVDGEKATGAVPPKQEVALQVEAPLAVAALPVRPLRSRSVMGASTPVSTNGHSAATDALV